MSNKFELFRRDEAKVGFARKLWALRDYDERSHSQIACGCSFTEQISVFDSGFLLGDGLWEGIRSINGVIQFAKVRATAKALLVQNIFSAAG